MLSSPVFSKRSAPLDEVETAAVVELRSALRALAEARLNLKRQEPRSEVQRDRLRDKVSAASRRVSTARRGLDEALSEAP